MNEKLKLTAASESELRAAARRYWEHPSAETFTRWQAAAKAALQAGELGK